MSTTAWIVAAVLYTGIWHCRVDLLAMNSLRAGRPAPRPGEILLAFVLWPFVAVATLAMSIVCVVLRLPLEHPKPGTEKK